MPITIATIGVGGTGANSASAALTALGAVAKTGDTMSGQLNISSGGLLVTGNVVLSANTSTDVLRITQTGSGNAIVIEDETNPDPTPFLVTNTGNVGIGVSSPLSYFHANMGSLRMIVQTDTTGATSPVNLWNSNTSNTSGAGMLFSAGGNGTTTGFIGGVSSAKINDPNNARMVFRVFSNGALSPVSDPANTPFYIEGNSAGPRVCMANALVAIGTTTPLANLHIVNGSTIIDTPVTSITANTTYAENGAGRVIFANTTSAITVTVANSSIPGFSYTIIRGNTGNVTIANSGVTRLNSASITSMNISQYGAATVVYTATNQVIVFGDFAQYEFTSSICN